jgi:hypothetical protein
MKVIRRRRFYKKLFKDMIDSELHFYLTIIDDILFDLLVKIYEKD